MSTLSERLREHAKLHEDLHMHDREQLQWAQDLYEAADLVEQEQRPIEPVEPSCSMPTNPGWYAVSFCWDVREGLIPGAGQWDGAEWGSRAPIVCHAGPFENKEAALEWARAHDLEG